MTTIPAEQVRTGDTIRNMWGDWSQVTGIQCKVNPIRYGHEEHVAIVETVTGGVELYCVHDRVEVLNGQGADVANGHTSSVDTERLHVPTRLVEQTLRPQHGSNCNGQSDGNREADSLPVAAGVDAPQADTGQAHVTAG